MLLDFRQLQFLLALDETKHFGRAAEKCFVTQPTLSMRIRNLEEELDLLLVKRDKRFEGFTDSGERILAWVKTLMAAHEGLLAEAENCKGSLVGTLRLGMVPLSDLNPMKLINAFVEKYPRIQFSIATLSSEQIIEQLQRNQLDIGFCYLDMVDTEHFEYIAFAPTTMGLLFDRRFFNFSKPQIAFSALSDLTFGSLSDGMHYQQSISTMFKSKGLDYQVVLTCDSSLQLVQAVCQGVCCAIMPLQNNLTFLNTHLRMLPIEQAKTQAPMAIMMRKSLPRSVKAERCFALAKSLYSAEGN